MLSKIQSHVIPYPVHLILCNDVNAYITDFNRTRDPCYTNTRGIHASNLDARKYVPITIRVYTAAQS